MKIEEYAPIGTKYCEGKCERIPLTTPTGPIMVCNGCMRILKDGRPEKIEEIKARRK